MLQRHIWPDSAALDGGRLTIAGCDVGTLAREHGTPLYMLDEATVRATARAYKTELSSYAGETSVHYACKALLNTAVAQLMASEGLGLDVVSGGELAIARRAGVDLAHVHLHGNATPPAELRSAIESGIGRIVVDNLDQLRELIRITEGRAEPQRILLRIAPGVAAGGHAHIQTGGADAKFGLRLDDGAALSAAEVALAASGVQMVGLHAHIGSQVRDFSAVEAAIERLLELAAVLREQHGWRLQELSPGGGLAVPALPEEGPVSIGDYAAALIRAVTAGCDRRGMALPRLVVEPGRSIIARAIVAVYTITGRKPLPGGRAYLHIDGGMGDNPRPALYGARYHAILPERAGEGLMAPYTIAGRYCESGDILIHEVLLPHAHPGDLLAVPVAGAYTLSMASAYNGVGRPPLLLLRDGRAHLIQRRETIDDLVMRDFPLPA